MCGKIQFWLSSMVLHVANTPHGLLDHPCQTFLSAVILEVLVDEVHPTTGFSLSQLCLHADPVMDGEGALGL